MSLETYLSLLSEHVPYEDDTFTDRVGPDDKKGRLRCACSFDYYGNRGNFSEYFSQVMGINTEYVKKVVEKTDKYVIINVSTYITLYHKYKLMTYVQGRHGIF